MRNILIITVLAVLFIGCNQLAIKTDYDQANMKLYYTLTDGKISVNYSDEECACIALLVLEEAKRRIESKELDWLLMQNPVFAKNYLTKLCIEMQNRKR